MAGPEEPEAGPAHSNGKVSGRVMLLAFKRPSKEL